MLSLCMIVRDAERTLAHALKSSQSAVDEIIVVDTGSTDSTVEVARAWQATVHHFPWRDDFSAARNYSLDQAHGDWILWMDADDELHSTAADIRKLLAGCPDRNAAFEGTVEEDVESSDGIKRRMAIKHVKLFPRLHGIRFEYRVHEQVTPSIQRLGLPILSSGLIVRHANADRSPEARRRRCERNLRLLQLDYQERPEDAFVLMNLGMTYLEQPGEDNARRAAEYLYQSLTRYSPWTATRLNAYLWLASAYRRLGRLEDEAETLFQAHSQFPGDTTVLLRLGDAWRRSGDLQAALSCFREAFDRPAHDTGVVHLAESRAEAVTRLAKTYVEAGQPDRGEAVLTEYLVASPNDWQVRKVLTELHIKVGNVSALERELEHIPFVESTTLPWRYGLSGCAAFMRENWELARTEFQKAHDQGYRPPLVKHGYAEALRRLRASEPLK